MYISLGDGGSAGDPQGNSQNLNVLLGKILRIDINSNNPYQIPSDNPFVNTPGARGEIYAYGLRNPWRFSFDQLNGQLWTGDVGQDRLEEVDLIEKGKNYGWRTMEANLCFKPSRNCDQSNLVLPVVQYDRSLGVSVTGGFVYRGSKLPTLVGAYIYGDFQSGNIWSLRYEDNKVLENKLILRSDVNISSFGQDQTGEVYVVDYSGNIFMLNQISNADSTQGQFPIKISETKCFSSLNPLTPAPGVVSYEVNSPLWSDGAAKDRFAFFPQGKKVQANDSGSWDIPEGSVFFKNFYIPQKQNNTIQNKLVETRFLVTSLDEIKGYSYKWNQDQSEAYFQTGATRETIPIFEHEVEEHFSYYYPSQSDCGRCHTDAKGLVLGFNTAQLNKTVNGQNQIKDFFKYDWFDGSNLSQDTLDWSKFVDYRNESEPLKERAHSFFEVQCSTCHNLQINAGQARLNLSYTTPLSSMGVCNKKPNAGNLGDSSAFLVQPGNPDKSLLYKRLTSTDSSYRMPAIATSRLDPDANKLIKRWIEGLADCNQE